MEQRVDDIPIDAQFESEYRMFIPLTIDDMEITDTNYFFSGTKLLLLALGFMPYFGIFFMLNSIPSVTVFIILTVIYFTGFAYYARFLVFEESKQRKQMLELENNKHSDMSYFWEWDKIGTTNDDTGLLYLQSDGASLKRGYIVKVDSGSDIGVPEGNFRNFRQTQQDFFRELYRLGMDVKRYNIRKSPRLSKALRDYSTMLLDLDRDEDSALIKLSQLNIDINFLYSMVREQRYVTYYVVINRRIENLPNFKFILEKVVDKTFGSNISFYKPHIMGKVEVDEFLTDFYGVDAVNSAGIHRMNGFKDLNDFVELVSIFDRSGKMIPFQMFDELSNLNTSFVGDKTLEELEAEQEKEDIKWDERRQRSYTTKEAALMAERREDKITHDEYQRRLSKLKFDHLPENFTEDTELTPEQLAKRNQLRQEEEWKELRKQRVRDKKNQQERKWYERDLDEELQAEGEVLTKPRVNTIVHDDGQIEWDALVEEDDISLEDLMRD